MNQIQKAQAFLALHTKADPLVLYNVWDAGTAQAVAGKKAKAIATGSWSVAAAQGYSDGQKIPLDFALQLYRRIADSTALPVSVDFEGAYAVTEHEIRENVTRLLETGAIGLNFEDQVIGSSGGELYAMAEQAGRVAAVRAAADAAGIPAVINARTDLFLKQPDAARHAALVEEAVTRGRAYRAAGADCFFVPGLEDGALITQICETAGMPVNVMCRDPGADLTDLKKCGVARISFGPAPYFTAMGTIAETAARHF